MTRSREIDRARLRGGAALAAVLIGGLLIAGCGSGDSADDDTTRVALAPLSASSSLSRATGDAYPCDPPAQALAADLLGVEGDDLFPGERYPSTGSCVFWSRVDPGEFGVVELDGLDSAPSSWPCGPDQVTEQERADVTGTPALARACTTP